MATTRTQLLGWIEHCEREHPGKGTHIPVWLCSMHAVHEAVADGDVKEIGKQPFRSTESFVIYGLTEQGRCKFYASLPVLTEQTAKVA